MCSLRPSVQCTCEQVWLSTSDDGWRALCLAGNDSGLLCHQHDTHLPLHWSYYRWSHNIHEHIGKTQTCNKETDM